MYYRVLLPTACGGFDVSIKSDFLEDTGLGGEKWGKLYWHNEIFLVQKNNIGEDQT